MTPRVIRLSMSSATSSKYRLDRCHVRQNADHLKSLPFVGLAVTSDMKRSDFNISSKRRVGTIENRIKL